MELEVKSIETFNAKIDSGLDGKRFTCVLGITLSDGRYEEIEVESYTNPREWDNYL